MILDTRYINNNFKDSDSKIMQQLNFFENITERNTKFHTIYSDKQKKDLIKDTLQYYITSDVLYIFMSIYVLYYNLPLFLEYYVGLIALIGFFILWIVYQIVDYKSISYGSTAGLIKYTEVVDYSEYSRYNELTLPKETLPDWMTKTDEVYTKESFDKVLNKFETKRIKEFIKKYKKLAFKSNKVIDNNKKLLTAWLKKEREGLVSLGVVKKTSFDYKGFWKEQGFSDEQIEKMYEEKMSQLSGGNLQ